MGHAITEYRNGLIMAVSVTEANGRAEPDAAVALLDELRERPRVRVKTVAGLVRTRRVGRWQLQQHMYPAACAFHLDRMRNLLAR